MYIMLYFTRRQERERRYQAFDPDALTESTRNDWMQGKLVDVSS